MILSNYNLQSCRKMCRNFFVKPGNFFLQKVEGFEGGLFQKLFKGYIFCLLGNSFGQLIFELFAHETNLEKKRSVMFWQIHM